MYKLANGWTKAKVMEQIKKLNNNNKAYDHVEMNCVYQTAGGNRCAIGCFIPEKHKKALEMRAGVVELLNKNEYLKRFLPFDCIEALASFQLAHDNSEDGRVYDSIELFLNDMVE